MTEYYLRWSIETLYLLNLLQCAEVATVTANSIWMNQLLVNYFLRSNAMASFVTIKLKKRCDKQIHFDHVERNAIKLQVNSNISHFDYILSWRGRKKKEKKFRILIYVNKNVITFRGDGRRNRNGNESKNAYPFAAIQSDANFSNFKIRFATRK